MSAIVGEVAGVIEAARVIDDIRARRLRGNAVLEWRVQGVAAATGLRYDNRYCGVFVVRGGEIAEVREYLDSLHAAHTLYADA